MNNNTHAYIDYVQECFDVLMEHGTDRYGEKHAPILVSILDVENRSCPENPEPLDEQWRVQRPNGRGAGWGKRENSGGGRSFTKKQNISSSA